MFIKARSLSFCLNTLILTFIPLRSLLSDPGPFISAKDPFFLSSLLKEQMSHDMTKPTMWLRPAKTQISLGIRPVWSESSLSAWRNVGSLATHWVHSEDSDQTGQMPRLIWVFAGRTLILLVLSWCGSNESSHEIMALFILRKFILQTCMRSHPVGLDVWFLVGPFAYFYTLCARTAKARVRLRIRAG